MPRYLINNTHPRLPELERQRDQLADRVAKLANEPDRMVVENFHYHDPRQAATTRGRLMCSCLMKIDELNKEICRIIAPGFAPQASEGFSDRVMAGLGR